MLTSCSLTPPIIQLPVRLRNPPVPITIRITLHRKTSVQGPVLYSRRRFDGRNKVKTMTHQKQTKSIQKNLTQGPINRQILTFFLPLVIGAFFQQLYNTVDASVVGQFAGTEALAAVGGSSGMITLFLFTFFINLATGATVVISQHFGAAETDKVDDALHTAYAFSILAGLFLGIIMLFLTDPFLRLLQTPENLMEASALYVRTLMVGLIFTLTYNMGAGILRAIGDSRRPLYILISATAINIILDLFFVAFLHMGVLGVGIATDISQGISALLVSWLLIQKTPGLRLSLRRLHLNPQTLARILRIGLPTAIAGSMFTISNMILQASLNQRGVNAMAAWTAYARLDAIWWMIDASFSASITTFIGQNFGAAKPDRIKKASRNVLLIELAFALVLTGLLLIFTPSLMLLFTRDAEVIHLAEDICRCIAPFYAIYAFSEVLGSILRAENKVLITTLINLLGICGFRAIWLLVIVPGGSVRQLFSCMPISWAIISASIAIYYLLQQPGILHRLESRSG